MTAISHQLIVRWCDRMFGVMRVAEFVDSGCGGGCRTRRRPRSGRSGRTTARPSTDAAATGDR
eukprot:10701005-Alexandrium_andersonii.AAC.1